MKTLIVTASLPYPPASGGAIRVYGILKGLHAAGHQITLLAFHKNRIDPMDSPLAQYCESIVTVQPPQRRRSDRLRDLLLSRQPDIARRLYSADFEARLRDLLTQQRFNLIQFEAIEVVAYLPLARSLQPDAKIVFDTFNAEYVLQRVIFEIDRQELKRWPAALFSLIQAGRIRRFEGEMCRLSDAVIAVSPEDAEALSALVDAERISIVPSGIFVNDYAQSLPAVKLPECALVFTGKMDYRPNVDAMLWFVESILPQIKKRIPGAHLTIVGQQPHPRLAPLAARDDITLTGWVDSVSPYLYAADVYIAPLRMGSGTRLKLLEAMASACAIVATPTAAAGMLDDARQGMRIAERAEDFAAAVVDLLQHPDQRQHLGDTARQRVAQYYDWSVLIPRLLDAYRKIGLG